jgi:hypothetical protein
MRGKGAAELPAAVRAVAESTCRSSDTLGFWTALGFQRQYSMVKEGSSVQCHIDGRPISVTGEQGSYAMWHIDGHPICAQLTPAAFCSTTLYCPPFSVAPHLGFCHAVKLGE